MIGGNKAMEKSSCIVLAVLMVVFFNAAGIFESFHFQTNSFNYELLMTL